MNFLELSRNLEARDFSLRPLFPDMETQGSFSVGSQIFIAERTPNHDRLYLYFTAVPQGPRGDRSKITQSMDGAQPLPVGPSNPPHYGAPSGHAWDAEAKAHTSIHPWSQAAGLSVSVMGIKAGIW